MKKLLFLLFALVTLLPAADLAGKWNFIWQTEGGERRSTLTFQVEGDKLKVLFPETKDPLQGAVEGDKITATGKVYSTEGGGEAPFRMDGKLTDGGKLEGTASWADHQMTFIATRSSE